MKQLITANIKVPVGDLCCSASMNSLDVCKHHTIDDLSDSYCNLFEETLFSRKRGDGKGPQTAKCEQCKRLSTIMKQTANMNNCQCPYCGNIFDGKKACNSNMDISQICCPDCGKIMSLDMSVEYLCTEILDYKEWER